MSVCNYIIYMGIIMTFIWEHNFIILTVDASIKLLKNYLMIVICEYSNDMRFERQREKKKNQ
jgi:hypothetical protein